MVPVSVIVPIHNVEEYLSICLESLSKQKIPDAEFICIDDGSTDRSLEICEQYASNDPRFKIFTQERSGPSKARNRGIDESTGEYIHFLDSDDYLEEDALEKLYCFAVSGDYDIVVHGANILSSEGNMPEWVVKATSPAKAEYTDFKIGSAFEIDGCRPFLWLHFIKSEIIKNNDIRFDEGLHIGEDQAFEIMYFHRASRVLFVEDKLYNYRLFRLGSTMHRYSSDCMGKMQNHIRMIQLVTSDLKPDLDRSSELILIKWIIELVYWDMIKLLYHDQSKFIHDIFRTLDSLNISNHVAELDEFDLVRFKHLETIHDHSGEPEKIIETMSRIADSVRNEIDRIESATVMKIYLRVLGKDPFKRIWSRV